jgi:preprotein translocase subunit YajC
LENIILFGALAVLIVFMFRNNKKRKQQADELQASIAVGTEVMLTSGIYGRIKSINGDRLVIETTPGTSLTVIKLAVREIVSAPEAKAKTPAKTTAKTTAKSAAKPAAKTATKSLSKPAASAKKTAK